MKTRQLATETLSNNQFQILLTGKFGDGSFITTSKNKQIEGHVYNYYYSTNCIYKEYLSFKKRLLDNLCKNDIKTYINKGYKIRTIYRLRTVSSPLITNIVNMSLEDSLNQMNELGLALWFFDDGSLHKTKMFYNLNTQKFSKEEHENIIIPFLFKKFNIKATLTAEHKKDGKEFWYLRIKKYDGAFYISALLAKYNLNCFSYKCFCSETIQKWSKLQEELKSKDIDINSLHARTITSMLNKISI